jgi:capsular exopolysaccharide synthesis family protein
MQQANTDLQRHAVDWWQVIKNRLGTILLTFILTFTVAAIITYIMPRKYKGSVEMRIERRPEIFQMDDRNGMMDSNAMAGSEVYVKTEFETITKAETLYPVIEKFDLMKRWNHGSRLDTLNKLLGNLDPMASVRSDYVTIDYFDEDPKMAADIANAIAESYMKVRVDKALAQKATAMATVEKKLKELEAEAAKARGRVHSAQLEGGIIDPTANYSARNPGTMVENSGTVTNTYRENELYKLKAEIVQLKTQYESLSGLSPDELIERASTLKVENQTLAIRYPEWLRLKSDREDLLAGGRGAQHPAVKSIDKKVTDMHQQILQAAEQHMLGLKVQLTTMEQNVAQLESLNKTTKTEAIGEQSKAMEYLEAKRVLENIEALQLQLNQQYHTTEINLSIDKAPATVWREAEVESAPAKPRIPLNLALGGLVGLLFGLGLAFALEFMDTTVKSMDDVERYLGIPVLAVVPKGVGVLHHSNGLSPDAEAYRILRTNLEFNRKNANANCLSVVSGSAGEGKSTTICNLAFVCAQAGYNVLLIDGDLRRPRQHTLFNTTNSAGLSTYLASEIPLQEVVLQTAIPNLYFLPAGPSPTDSAGLLNSQRMSDLVADVKSRFDLVLIDSPPILGVSDAAVIANAADSTIIVLQHRKLPRQMLSRVKQAVEAVGGNVAGAVLNNVDTRSDASYQYYTSYYSYCSSAEATDPSLKAKRKKRKTTTPAATAPALASAPKSSPMQTQPSGNSRQDSDLF